MPLDVEVGLGSGDFVLDGDPLPKKGGRDSCGQMVGLIKMLLAKVVGLDPGHIVLDGDPHSSPSPLSAHAYCDQTVVHLSNC